MTGPLSPGIAEDLEELKRKLADMDADDLDTELTKRMAVEISAIRLQLKRLSFEQQAMLARLEKLRDASSATAT
ncbi:MAG TPA: hypothetical protein VGH92_12045 [Gaiellaceae bacterium]